MATTSRPMNILIPFLILGRSVSVSLHSTMALDASDGALVLAGVEDLFALLLAVLLFHAAFDVLALLGERHDYLP